MRSLLIFAAICAICYTAHLPSSGLRPTKVKTNLDKLRRNVNLPDDLVAKLRELFEEPDIYNEIDPRDISAVINEYADRILENVDHSLIEYGFDPFELPDQELDFIGGNLKMSNGWLTQLATLQRNGDLIVSYSTETKILTFSIPLEFTSLLFLYDYAAKVALITIDGTVDGKVDNVRINLVLGFDFNDDQASLDLIDVTDTGKISIHFTGNGLVDWIINAMTDVVTLFLHPLILGIAEMIVKVPAEKIVEIVNEVIAGILHPPTETTTELPPTEAIIRSFYRFLKLQNLK